MNSILEFFNQDIKSLMIFAIFFVFMFILFLKDIFSPRVKHIQTIFTLGILGTFIGIAWGLIDFDEGNIANSIPELLKGLKMAFFSSICGMIFAILIELIKGQKKESPQNQDEYLKSIYEILSDNINNFKQGFSQQNELIKGGFETLIKSDIDKKSIIQKSIEEINGHFKTMINDTNKNHGDMAQKIHEQNQSIRRHSNAIVEVMRQGNIEIKQGFDNVDGQLKGISKDISQGASKAIVEALKKAMEEFNKNLKDSFGENFKQLNESCSKMILWQEEYKKQVEQGVVQLEKLVKTLNIVSGTSEKILKNSQDSITLSKEAEKLILGCNGHIESMTKLLSEYGNLAQGARSMFETTGEGFKKINTTMNGFSEELRREFPKSLNILNQRLTDVTEQFIKAYSKFLQDKK